MKLVNHPHVVLSPPVVINVLSERAVHDVCGGVAISAVRSVWHRGVVASSATPKALKAQFNHALPDAFCETAFDIASGMCAAHLLCVQRLEHQVAIRTSVVVAQLWLM